MTRSRNTADVYSEGTLLDIANAQSGTATFSSDVYTFTTLSGEYPTLQAGMSISFKLPTGSVNTTTTPTISYNSTEYTIKWIDGSALAASDLDVTYNKHPISFYFDGTDMLIASDISGSNSDGDFVKYSNGNVDWVIYDTINSQVSGNTTYPLPLTLASADFFSGLSSNAGSGEATTDDLEFISNCAARSFSTTQVIINATLSEAGGSATNKITIFGKGRWY